jgi:hypothetical protein
LFLSLKIFVFKNKTKKWDLFGTFKVKFLLYLGKNCKKHYVTKLIFKKYINFYCIKFLKNLNVKSCKVNLKVTLQDMKTFILMVSKNIDKPVCQLNLIEVHFALNKTIVFFTFASNAVWWSLAQRCSLNGSLQLCAS